MINKVKLFVMLAAVLAAEVQGGYQVAIHRSLTQETWVGPQTHYSTHNPYPSPPPKPSPPPAMDRMKIIWMIREGSLSGNHFLVAEVLLSTDDVGALAEGFRYEASERELFTRRTPERVNDADVAAIKGIAKATNDAGNLPEVANKLAKVAVMSVRPTEIYCCYDVQKLESVLEGSLMDAEAMSELVEANPAEGSRRRLQQKRQLLIDGASPANSLVCSACWKQSFCVAFHWCAT